MVDVGNLETLDSLGAKVCFLFSQFSIFWPNSSKQIYSLIKPRLQWRRNVGADTFRHNRVFTTTTNLGRKLRWIRHENCDEMSSQSRVYNGDEFVTSPETSSYKSYTIRYKKLRLRTVAHLTNYTRIPPPKLIPQVRSVEKIDVDPQ